MLAGWKYIPNKNLCYCYHAPTKNDYFNVFSMTFCSKCVHKKYSKLLPLPYQDKNPRQELFKSPLTFFLLFLIQHFLKCGTASRHPAERGGGFDTEQEIFAKVWGKRGTIHIWLGKQSNINAGGLFGKKGDAGDISLGDNPIIICSVLRDLVPTSFLK